MAKVLPEIDDRLRAWIAAQPMFFVATAPLAEDGHVNVSPKGPIGTLQILGPHEVAYLDLGGSGAETVAHVRENGRIVVMFCAFQGPPRIVRLHGRAEAIFPGEPGWDELDEGWRDVPGVEEARRSVIRIDVTRVSDSCGYGVPLMAPEGERPHYGLSSEKKLRTKGSEGYRRHHDRGAVSLDGLPGVASAPESVAGGPPRRSSPD